MKAKITSQVCHSERLDLQSQIPLATPLVIYVEPSGFCSLRCGFCPHGTNEKTFKKDLMSVDLFKKFVDDLALFPNKVK